MAACLQGNRLQKTALPAFAKCMLVACLSSKVLPIDEHSLSSVGLQDAFRVMSEIFRDFLGGPGARVLHYQCRGPGWIPDQGTRSHMLQLK